MDRRAFLLVLVAALVATALLLWRWDTLQPPPEAPGRAPADAGGAATSPAEAADVAEAPPLLEGRDLDAAARPSESLPPGPRVTGLVLDAAGTPVAGARVVAVGDTNGKPFPSERAGTKGAPGFAATTDPAGRFAVPVSADAPYHFLLAHAPGRGFAARGNVPIGADVTLRLEPALALVGTVRDRAQVPVVGARVHATLLLDTIEVEREAVSGDGGAYRIEDLPGPAYRPNRPWPGYHAASWFEVTADGFAPLAVEDVLASAKPPEHRQDFTISRGATLVGRVEDAESGAAVAGAAVALHSVEGMMGYHRSGGEYSTPWAPRPLARTTTAKDGTFSIEHVPSLGAHGTASHNAVRGGGRQLGGLAVWAAGYAAQAADVTVPEDGERREVVLRLWPAAVVTGRLVEKDGTPATGAGVHAKVEGRAPGSWIPPLYEGVPASHAPAGDDGRFRLDGVPASRTAPTEVTLALYRTRAGPRVAPNRTGEGSSKATVRAGETLDVGDLPVEPLDLLETTTVVVTDPDGRPVFGATLGRGFQRTDAEGRLEWVWARPGEGRALGEVEVVARAPGFAPTPVALSPPGSGRGEVRVTLRPGHRLAGRVLEEDGRPGGGRAVTVGDGSAPVAQVFPEGRAEHELRIGEVARGRSTPLAHATTWTDDDGRFGFEDLPEGPYHVLATKPRRVSTGARTPALRAIVSDVASDATDVVLRLPPDDSPPTGSIAGSITSGGKPLPSAGVTVLRGETRVASAWARTADYAVPPGTPVVDSSGAFEIPDVPVGRYDVRIQAPDLRPTTLEGVEVRAGETTRLGAVGLERGATVVGRVVAPSGLSVENRAIEFRSNERGERPSARLGAGGSFRVGGLAPGRWVPVVQSVGRRGTEAAPLLPSRGEVLAVGPGDDQVTLDVSWAAAGTLTLAPAIDRLPPAPWSQDAPTPEETAFGKAARAIVRGPSGEVVLDVTGLHRFQSGAAGWLVLLPGRYEARLELPDGDVREETVELVAGTTVRVQFARK